MDNTAKKHLMEKMMRELQDIVNSQTSLLKKISQSLTLTGIFGVPSPDASAMKI